MTIYVQFSQPRFDEVRLWVQANSRDDVSVLPESLAFGRIKRGGPATATATVSFLGNSNWQITNATSDSNYILPQFEQIRRDSGEVSYKLTASIRPNAPPGKWFTDVWLQTNNASSPRIRVPLTVEIEAPLTITPSQVSLGEVKIGKWTEKKVVLLGVRPFRVVGIEGTDNQVSVNVSTAESQKAHVLTVTVRPQQPGALQRTLRVVTDLPGDEAIEFHASAIGTNSAPPAVDTNGGQQAVTTNGGKQAAGSKK